jgi:two-component system CheB/CheR fusion protein
LSDTSQPAAERIVVGLGASAGGLAALKTFFQSLPEKTGLTFVVIMHLSPDRDSHVAELLQPILSVPVTQVHTTILMEPDHVYVIPPGSNLSAVDSHLRLSDLEKPRGGRAPIDHFFRTLATTHDGRAVGVILSGTGSDGALGIKAIRERGGLTLVQDPAESEYDGMPRSAIATGLVDHVLPVADMPGVIVRYARTRPNVGVPAEESSDVEQYVTQILSRLRARTGRDFTDYKSSTVVRRIQRRMQINQVENISTYADILNSKSGEAASLADDMLINVTNFFRDTEVFTLLERDIVPALFRGKTADDDLRVWIVGCATGEEAYSLAILLLEHAHRTHVPPRVQVFASDLHDESLASAREGFYPGEISSDIEPERLERFFMRYEGGYKVSRELRDTVVFTTHNLLADPPFSRLDMISCRNLLIYLRRRIQPRVLELFHYALRPAGFLLLGTSETGDDNHLFRSVSKAHCIFQKEPVPPAEVQLPVFPLAPGRVAGAPLPPRDSAQTYSQIHLTLLEHYAPPSLIVSADHKVVHMSPQVGRFLVHSGGEPTTGVLKLVKPEFRASLGEILFAAHEGRETTSEPILMSLDGERRAVSMTARPAPPGAEHAGFVLVLFNEWRADADDAEVEQRAHASSGSNEDQLSLLRQRLQSVLEEQDATQEDMRAANEELQSSNEELRSTMEELETSKEELQSVNEELMTVNQENRNKVDELAALSGDLQSLMAATQIATLFLDRELRVVRFTPQLGDVFHIRMTDKGRPVAELKAKVAYEELLDDLQRVLDGAAPVEREIRHASDQRWFLTRVLPYHGAANRLDGAVITFVDVTRSREAEDALHKTAQKFRGLVEASAQIVWTTNGQGVVVEDSESWREFTGQSFDERKGWGWLDAIHPEDRAGVRASWQEAVRTGDTFVSEFRVYHNLSGDYRWTVARAFPTREPDGQPSGWVGMNIDVSQLRAADDALRDADKRKDEFLAVLGHELRNPLAPLMTGIQLLRVAASKPELVETLQTMMSRQLAHLVRLVDDLLDLSRISRGQVNLVREPLDLRMVIETALEAIRPTAIENRQQVTVNLPTTPLPVDGDFHRLTQVIGNLVANATRYTPSGGRIDVSASEKDERIVVKVRDNGFGIPSERVGKLFRMFSQVPEHRARTGGGGLGIGLALSRHLVELHGGSIGVSSEGLGKGSVFTVRLPTTKRRLAVKSEQADWHSTDMPLRRVLVVDDNVDAATSLGMLLAAKGHTVQTVHDAGAALRAVGAFAPEIMLLDIELPDMSGYEIARRVRLMDGGAEIALIAVTGRGQPDDKDKARKAGFDEHLTKPVDLSLLATLIGAASVARSS